MLVALIPIAVSTGVLNTCVNSAITSAVPPEEMGDALGTASALESLSRVVAAPVGGWLLGTLGMWAPGVVGAIIMGGLSVFTWRRFIALGGRAIVRPAQAA